jgi:hypothetical protein
MGPDRAIEVCECELRRRPAKEYAAPSQWLRIIGHGGTGEVEGDRFRVRSAPGRRTVIAVEVPVEAAPHD